MMTNLRMLALLAILGAALPAMSQQKAEILNASYDVSRELFAEINPAFQAAWRAQQKQDLDIHQSHGGSSKQARSVAEGLRADVVTFNQATDIDFLAKSGLVAADWAKKFPHGASPYYSLPVFLVRAGLVSVDEAFGGWDRVTAEHFGADGILDRLLVDQR